jgi:hypothetical protein
MELVRELAGLTKEPIPAQDPVRKSTTTSTSLLQLGRKSSKEFLKNKH